MDATTLRTAQAVTPTSTAGSSTAARTTNGPSSTQPIAGGGPVAAPTQPTLLGVVALTPPKGEAPKTITLPDGSLLVPLGPVGSPAANAASVSLAPKVAAAHGGGAAAAVAPTAASTSSHTAATGGGLITPTASGFEPKGFLYNDRYFAKFHAAGGIDLADKNAVERRMAKSTMAYLLEEEPEVDDFGITGIDVRRADPAADRDLLTVNPRSHYVADVKGVDGNGRGKSIPLVMNGDGAVFVDPRVSRW